MKKQQPITSYFKPIYVDSSPPPPPSQPIRIDSSPITISTATTPEEMETPKRTHSGGAETEGFHTPGIIEIDNTKFIEIKDEDVEMIGDTFVPQVDTSQSVETLQPINTAQSMDTSKKVESTFRGDDSLSTPRNQTKDTSKVNRSPTKTKQTVSIANTDKIDTLTKKKKKESLSTKIDTMMEAAKALPKKRKEGVPSKVESVVGPVSILPKKKIEVHPAKINAIEKAAITSVVQKSPKKRKEGYSISDETAKEMAGTLTRNASPKKRKEGHSSDKAKSENESFGSLPTAGASIANKSSLSKISPEISISNNKATLVTKETSASTKAEFPITSTLNDQAESNISLDTSVTSPPKRIKLSNKVQPADSEEMEVSKTQKTNGRGLSQGDDQFETNPDLSTDHLSKVRVSPAITSPSPARPSIGWHKELEDTLPKSSADTTRYINTAGSSPLSSPKYPSLSVRDEDSSSDEMYKDINEDKEYKFSTVGFGEDKVCPPRRDRNDRSSSPDFDVPDFAKRTPRNRNVGSNVASIIGSNERLNKQTTTALTSLIKHKKLRVKKGLDVEVFRFVQIFEALHQLNGLLD